MPSPDKFSSYSYRPTYRSVGRSVSAGQTARVKSSFKHLLPILNSRYILASLLVILALGGTYAGWNKHVAAASAATQKQQAEELAEAQARASVFNNQLATLASQNPGIELSIAVGSEKLGIQTYGSRSSFDAASTAKLLTATVLLKQVELGKVGLTTNIDGQPAQTLIEKMVVKSDDQAWMSLNQHLGHPQLADYARQFGMTSYDPEINNLTAKDMVTLVSKLTKGSLLTNDHQQLLLGYMSRANFRNYALPAVEPGNQAYHKVGINDDTVNEVLTIEHSGQRLILAIFTNGNGVYNWQQRAQLMQRITQDAQVAFFTP